MNVKILKSLNRTWQPKVIAIFESKYLTSITYVKVFGKLREYEIDKTRMAEKEDKENKNKCLALKSSRPSSNEESAKGSKSENLTLIVRKFKKQRLRWHNSG